MSAKPSFLLARVDELSRAVHAEEKQTLNVHRTYADMLELVCRLANAKAEREKEKAIEAQKVTYILNPKP